MEYKLAFIEDCDEDYQVTYSFLERFSSDENVSFAVRRFLNGEEFLKSYQPGDYDAVFFDILLGEEHTNGLDSARALFKMDPNVAILFITNMGQYAINGYEVDAVDYIVKPVKYYDFSLKLKKLISLLSSTFKQNRKITFKQADETVMLNENEILFVIVTSHYLTIYTENNEYVVREPLKTFEKRLSTNFVRSGISYLVNVTKIDRITSTSVIIKNHNIPITRLYKKAFLQKINEYMINKTR